MLVRRPHVLQVFQPAIGGVPAYVANLARGLSAHGWRVSAAAPPQHACAAQLGEVAENQIVIDSANGWSPDADARALRVLIDFVRREQVDLIHAHSSKASLLAGLAAARTGCASVYTPHTWAFQRPGNRLGAASFAAIEALLARRCHRRIIAVSASEAAAALHWRIVAPAAIEIVRSGLPATAAPCSRADARRQLALDPALPVVAWIGRLHRAKRPQDLAPLAERLHGKALVAALGHDLASSEPGEALQRAGGRVVDGCDPRVLLAAADLLVLTSAWEALPFCVLEAMQASLPVVAYDVGDLHAQVVDGASGFLVDQLDVNELARRVTLLVDDPSLRAAFGAAARSRFEACFSYDAMVRTIDRVYGEVLGVVLRAPQPTLPRPAAAPEALA